MEFFNVLLILSNVFTLYADNVSVKYKKYLGTVNKGGGAALAECAESIDDTCVGLAFNITSASCEGLPLSWLEDKQTEEEQIYMLKIRSNEEFDPPKLFYRSSDVKKYYYRHVPVELKYGSLLDLYLSSSSTTTGFKIVLRLHGDYLLRATVSYAQSTIYCTAKYNNIWSGYTEQMHVQFTANKVEKFSFRTVSDGFKIYHDDQWLADFSDDASPHSSVGCTYLTIWVYFDDEWLVDFKDASIPHLSTDITAVRVFVHEGNTVYLHRIVFTQ